MKFKIRKKISVMFFGNPKISVSALNSLINNKNFDVKVVVTNKDKAIGRNHSLAKPTELANFTKNLNITVIKTDDINSDIDLIKEFKIDLIITCAFGQKLSDEVLGLAKLKALNIHASLLPKGRGGAPIHWAIINGETQTGFTIMDMINEMDAGNYYHQEVVEIDKLDTFDTLYKKLSKIIYEESGKIISEIIKKPNLYPSIKQETEKVSYWNILKKEEIYINFNKPAEDIINHIRGLNSIPGAKSKINNIGIKIYHSDVYNKDIDLNKKYLPGEIIEINKNGIIVATKTKPIVLDDILIDNKKRVYVRDFINGNNILKVGDIFKNE